MKNLYLKKITFLLKSINLGILFLLGNYSFAQSYCNFGGYDNPGSGLSNYITNLTITGGGINNTTSGTDGSYHDYTGNTDGTVTKDSSYGSSVTYNKSLYPNYLGVYIDWNDDGDFNDANEVIVNNVSLTTGSGSGTYSFTIHVPTGAATSTVRMRVYDNSNAGACAYSYGEAEDYEIVVSATASGPTAEAGSNQTICNGTSINLGGSPTVSGGTSPYTYAWSASLGTNPSATANPSVTPTVTTTYTLTVTDNNSATSTDNVVITVNAIPTAEAGNNQTICNGTSTNLTATGGITYAWNTSATTATITVTPTTVTTYTVTVTSNSCTATDNVVVSISPIINAGNDVAICIGTSTTLTAQGGITYVWNNNATTISTTVTPTQTSTYTVTGTDNNSCTASDAVVVTINPSPTVNIQTSDVAVTQGKSATLTVSGNGNFIWFNSSTSSSIIVSPSNTTSYAVTVTDVNGCTASADITISVNVNTTTNIGGDVTGTPNNLIVTGLRGRAISDSIPLNGQLIMWDSLANKWIATTDIKTLRIRQELILGDSSIHTNSLYNAIYNNTGNLLIQCNASGLGIGNITGNGNTFINSGTAHYKGYFPNTGHVGIGFSTTTTSLTEKLEVNGNIKASGIGYFNMIKIRNANDTNARLVITPQGKLWAQEVKVNVSKPTGYPDFVFGKEYKIRSIHDLEQYIKTKGHLPEVPTAAETVKDGLDLGQMNILLLKKVEELTLYIIDLQKQIDQLKK